MKKVLIIIGKLTVGGAERVARDIGYFADKKHFEIHYIVYEQEIGAYEKELTSTGCVIHHFDPPRKNHLKYYRELRELINKENFDVIHCHTMFSSGWAVLAGYRCKVPKRITHSHTVRGFEKRGFIKNLYENSMRTVIQKYSTDYIGCGKSAGEWLFGKAFFEQFGKIIFNGIDLKQFQFNGDIRNQIREMHELDDCFVIGHVGHLAEVKNQSFIIRLLPKVLEKRANVKLLLLGDGDDRSQLEGLIHSLKLDKSIILTGNVNNVGEYMSAMDLFVFPSLYEGMPLALIEAQTNGLPCLISDKIPDDAIQTNLVHKLSLNPDIWINEILRVSKTNRNDYYEKMFNLGFDKSVMLQKIYQLYKDE